MEYCSSGIMEYWKPRVPFCSSSNHMSLARLSPTKKEIHHEGHEGHEGFGYSSRQDAKNAKFGNLFLLCAFASLRKCSDSFWLRLRRAGFSAVDCLSRENPPTSH